MHNNRKIILHCHLFKNAGSTLDWALERNFGSGFCDHRDDLEMRQQGMDYLEEFIKSNSKLRAISSHHMPFRPKYAPDYWWLVLLREPIRRVRSVYEFEFKQPISSLGSKMAKELNFSDYIIWRMRNDVPAVIKNYQVRYLNSITDPGKIISESAVEHAIKYLQLDNVIVGTVECFDESMVLFEEKLKTVIPDIDLSYIRQNVTQKDGISPLAFIDDLTEKAKDMLLENNKLDKLLYDKVNADFQKTIANIPGFKDKLFSFQKRCSKLTDRSL